MNKSNMSKKAAVALVAIQAIISTKDWRAQAFVFGIAAVVVLVQGALDWLHDSD